MINIHKFNILIAELEKTLKELKDPTCEVTMEELDYLMAAISTMDSLCEALDYAILDEVRVRHQERQK